MATRIGAGFDERKDLQVRLHMNTIGRFVRLPIPTCNAAIVKLAAAALGFAVLVMTTGMALAQNPAPGNPIPEPHSSMSVPEGYTVHEAVDVGGHMTNVMGSPAMYDTLVNMSSGPRILGETFELRAMPGTKNPLLDSFKAYAGGLGGDPYSFAKVNFYKGKTYEFSGLFRRDRQYFDYDLLGNPNIVPNSIAIGPSEAPTGTFAWGPVNQSPVMFNSVRRMTDTSLTLFPLSTFTYRVSYSRYNFEGPSLSPSYAIAKYDALLSNYQRNSIDDFTGSMEWKPVQGTRLSFEEQVSRYKADSYFILAPSTMVAQEADGRRVAIGNWDSQAPYGIGGCNTTSMGAAYTNPTTYTIFTAAQVGSSLPVINAACSVVTSYMRSQPTRILSPTEIIRLQSSSIKNVTMNGNVRYTTGTMDLSHYYEGVTGLMGAIRQISYNGYAKAHRAVIAADYGFIWQATPWFTLSDQANFSNAQDPGYSNLPIATTLSTPLDTKASSGNETITYNGPLTSGHAQALPHGVNGYLTYNFFGQRFLTNNVTGSWEPSPRTTLSLTYRYGFHDIAQGVPHNVPIPLATGDPVNGTVSITENTGILGAAYRVTDNWNLNGSVEIGYFDNAFTSVGARQFKQFKIRTAYKPRPWATITAAYNDRERHNNTNNALDVVAAGQATYFGPINHIDYSRIASVGAILAPNEKFGLDLSYGYTDVYAATNTCYTSGASATLPGAVALTNGVPRVCPGIFARGGTNLVDFFARDYINAPTEYGSVSVNLSPVRKFRSNVGYRVSAVNGDRFFNDARDVAGSLVSTYQSPFANVSWKFNQKMTWKAEYNYYGYGEGGPSGALYCSTTVSATATITPCAQMSSPTGRNEASSGLSAARNFHANNVTLGVHYEF